MEAAPFRLRQKYNPNPSEYVWEEDGCVVGCMLGQFVAQIHPCAVTPRHLNELAEGFYVDLCRHCRYPQLLLSFSDGTISSFMRRPGMWPQVEHFYGLITEYVDATFEHFELAWPNTVDYMDYRGLQAHEKDVSFESIISMRGSVTV